MFSVDGDRAPTHSQFSMRVAVLGGVALVAFVAIFFRLWFLQVLSGEAYLREANANRVREVKIPAPRGEILDRHDKVLVDNRTVLSLQVRPDKLFESIPKRNHELKKLGSVAGIPYNRVKRKIREGTKLLPASPVTLQEKVDEDLVYYLRERQDRFPGVSAEQVYVRNYPDGTLGAHLFGYVSEINGDQLKEPAYDGLEPGDRIGATGLELQYDNVLRGLNGSFGIQVDASGNPLGPELHHVDPVSGENLKLTLDEKIQRSGEQALLDWGGYDGKPGAFVVMKINDGSILGMGSYPTFDPSDYTPPVSSKKIDSLTNDESKPLLNRATQASYVTGSTFKLITGTAALEEGLRTPETTFDDTGSFRFGGRPWQNAGGFANGVVNMISALRVSSDVYFYDVGIDAERVYDDTGKEIIQDWASKLGFGQLTGIDLPGEGAGLIPTPEWRNQLYKDALKPDSPGGTTATYPQETDRRWSVGDDMNFAVGQGDLGATPLQLAVAYAAMGNGGDIVRPHLAMEAEDANGAVTQQFEPEPSRHVDISEETRSTIMEGLREAANEPGGTSEGVFAGFPIEIAGKTGTAEKTYPLPDQSWYAAIAPFDNPKYVVVVTIEGGGFGADAAAPATRDILSTIFNVKAGQIEDTGGTLGR